MIATTHYVVRTETRADVSILECTYRTCNPLAADEECRRQRGRDHCRRARYTVVVATSYVPPFATRRYVFTS